MEDDQLSLCQKYGIYSRKFCGIYMKRPKEEEMHLIFEQLMEWHLNTK